ncbi:TetR/AcrR family transcriptional regulator [Saccharopolyspora phatthalungensis]|uniref:AcrR family transcriptional regulator n=1 Tax=Saccharopolyspora phatthalungensis TaxID=664693 RepID=A0A840QIA9_9PSEU|nr:TetR/AcrR family transcriptional regulator [Saccharopolyspora phatthalungensis]MBB5157103.1 AcrR family transcriptional regulator [Saccharopolyspora phatthalungensis]
MSRPDTSPENRTPPAVTTQISQPDVVRAALELSANKGLEALSIRRVATALGISPMSVYKFVTSKDELLDAMLLHLLDRMEIPYTTTTDWREQIVQTMLAWRDLVEEQPGAVQMLATRRLPPGSAGLARLAEQVLSALEHGGITGPRAARAFWQTFSATVGHIVFERARASLDDRDQDAAREAMHQTAVERGFDHVANLATDLTRIETRGTLDDALRVLLTGLSARR